MEEQQFFRMVTQERYTATEDLADLETALGSVVRIRCVDHDGTRRYLPGGVLTVADVARGSVAFKSLVNGRSYNLKTGRHGVRTTFYVLDQAERELRAWQEVVSKLVVEKLP